MNLERTQTNSPGLSSDELTPQQSASGDLYAKAARSVPQQSGKKYLFKLDDTSQILLTILEKLTKQKEVNKITLSRITKLENSSMASANKKKWNCYIH